MVEMPFPLTSSVRELIRFGFWLVQELLLPAVRRLRGLAGCMTRFRRTCAAESLHMQEGIL